jgi:transcriptional regulator with XRE-family HTH domain
VKKFLGDHEGWVSGINGTLRANGKTQAALAVAAGMDPSQLNRYLTLTVTPSMETMLRIEHALDELTGG